jgi:nitrite reductase (NADH) small subunit
MVGRDTAIGRRAASGRTMTMQNRCNEASETAWTRVGTLDDIPRLGCRVVQTRDIDIAIFRTADDRVFALFDRCPHKQGKLSQGIVHGTSVTCPLHNWVIGLDDGAAKDPDTGCVHTVPARIEGRDILLALGS